MNDGVYFDQNGNEVIVINGFEMMKVLYLLMLIAGLLWIGDFSITLKPFSVSLPCWYKSVGILLFWLSMTIYVLGEHTKGYKEGFDTGINQCIKILDRNCHSKEINNDETVQNQ